MTFLGRRHGGMGEWFLNSLHFAKWNPVEQALANYHYDNKIRVAFQYLNYKRQEEQTVEKLLGAISRLTRRYTIKLLLDRWLHLYCSRRHDSQKVLYVGGCSHGRYDCHTLRLCVSEQLQIPLGRGMNTGP